MLPNHQGEKRNCFLFPWQCTRANYLDDVKRPTVETEYEYLHPTDHTSVKYIVARPKAAARRVGPKRAVKRNAAEPSEAASSQADTWFVVEGLPLHPLVKKKLQRKKLTKATLFSCPLCCPSCRYCPRKSWTESHAHYVDAHWDRRRFLGRYTIFPCGNCCELVRAVAVSQPPRQSHLGSEIDHPDSPKKAKTGIAEFVEPPRKKARRSSESCDGNPRASEDSGVQGSPPSGRSVHGHWCGYYPGGQDDEGKLCFFHCSPRAPNPNPISESDGEESSASMPNTSTKDLNHQSDIHREAVATTEHEAMQSQCIEKPTNTTSANHAGSPPHRSCCTLSDSSTEQKCFGYHFHCPVKSCPFVASQFQSLLTHGKSVHPLSEADPRSTPDGVQYAPFISEDFTVQATHIEVANGTDDIVPRIVPSSTAVWQSDLRTVSPPRTSSSADLSDNSLKPSVLASVEDDGPASAATSVSSTDTATIASSRLSISTPTQVTPQHRSRSSLKRSRSNRTTPGQTPSSVRFSPYVRVRTYDSYLSRIEKLSSVLGDGVVIADEPNAVVPSDAVPDPV